MVLSRWGVLIVGVVLDIECTNSSVLRMSAFHDCNGIIIGEISRVTHYLLVVVRHLEPLSGTVGIVFISA